ncbi:MAG TPA: hypothetical protein VIR57_07600 [Chloroflexota bacterium]
MRQRTNLSLTHNGAGQEDDLYQQSFVTLEQLFRIDELGDRWELNWLDTLLGMKPEALRLSNAQTGARQP